MNAEHLRLCASAEWAELVGDRLLPWVLAGGDDELGDDVLEVGAGPGLVTDLLVGRVARVTAVEIDPVLADALRARLPQVEVVTGDATALPLPDARFSAVACFTMLHHIPGPADQDRALAEMARVLRPGGLLLGTDGEDTPPRRALHVDDVFTPIDPAGLPDRLRTAGFAEVLVDSDGDRFRFRARR